MDFGSLPRFPAVAGGGDSGADRLRDADRQDRTWGWVAVGLVAAGLAAAGGLLLLAGIARGVGGLAAM